MTRSPQTPEHHHFHAPTRVSTQSRHLIKLHSLRDKLGLTPEAPLDHQALIHDEDGKELWWPHIRYLLREPFAEFWGTFVMILFGDGVVAQVVLTAGDKGAPGGDGFGNYQSISWCWGIGVMLGIYVAGDSGGFLNPAITFSSCLYRGLPWKRFPIYFVAQFLGGMLGSAVVYANYYGAIDNYEGKGIRTVPPAPTATAGIFCTYPAAFLTKGQQFVSEFITSSILMFCIMALKDDFNVGAMGKNTGSTALFPLALFFLIFGLGAAFGEQTGYAINLARDLAPRLMSYIVGYGPEVWSAGDYYFWVPCVASFVGCVFGGGLYDLFIYAGPESPFNKPAFGLKAVAGKFKRSEGRKKWGDTERQMVA